MRRSRVARLLRTSLMLSCLVFLTGIHIPTIAPPAFGCAGVIFPDCRATAVAQSPAGRNSSEDPPGTPPKQATAQSQSGTQSVTTDARSNGNGFLSQISFTNTGTPSTPSRGFTEQQCTNSEQKASTREIRLNVVQVSTAGPPTSDGITAMNALKVSTAGPPTSEGITVMADVLVSGPSGFPFFTLVPGQAIVVDLLPGDFVSHFLSVEASGDADGTTHVIAEMSWNEVGAACTTDADCTDPDFPFCVQNRCRAGIYPDACVDDGDCEAGQRCQAGVCTPEAGSRGQPCGNPGDCALGLACIMNRCESTL